MVATPIGNLEDLSMRAARVLAQVDIIAAEDTRRTRILLRHLAVTAPKLVSLHEHNETQRVQSLVDKLQSGLAIALVSDAGTPLISDPGYRLVRAASEQKINIVSVPGPSAITAALSVSGLATDRFVFEGFLPQRSAARQARLRELVNESRTLVFFESPRRIDSCMQDLCIGFGDFREAAICRELTKRFESVMRGSLGELRDQLAAMDEGLKGEIVVLVAGAQDRPESSAIDEELLLGLLAQALPPRAASEIAAKLTGKRKNDLYQEILRRVRLRD